MNKRDYLEKLLSLCTEKQANLFSRMYPDGPNIKQLSWAITQLENTLKDLNYTREALNGVKKAAKSSADVFSQELKRTERKLVDTEQELKEANCLIDRLKNPINTENNEVQEKLELLEALQQGGVDNWTWYDEAIKNYRDNNV